MKIFVVSWFYPPTTTSEALVTYKLLSNSANEYYLCSASSKNWSYNKESKLTSSNVKQFIFNTDDFDEFINQSILKYQELSKKIKFDAIMTRSMPPESQLVGLKIKEFDKNIPWIVSLADPIGNNPYETLNLLNNRIKLVRKLYYHAPNFCLNNICRFARSPQTKKLEYLNKLQQRVVKSADIVIVPDIEQGRYIMPDEKIFKQKCMIVPHSYDKKLYPKLNPKNNEKLVFSFVGHTDHLRSIEPIIRALKIIRDINPDALNKIKFRLVGNIPSYIKNMIYVFFLNEVVSLEGTVNYEESLKVMEESDYLIHIDAFFSTLPYGSIFFAAKIADYLGAKKPILGIANSFTPAGKIITSTGGKCLEADPMQIAKTIIEILKTPLEFNEKEAEKYNSVLVAKEFDAELARRLSNAEE